MIHSIHASDLPFTALKKSEKKRAEGKREILFQREYRDTCNMYDTPVVSDGSFAIDFNGSPLQLGQCVHMFFLLLALATRRNTFILGTDPLPR